MLSIWSNDPLTANIGDVLNSTKNIEADLLWTQQWTHLSLQSLKSFDETASGSLRVMMFYNDIFKKIASQSLQSSYWFSTTNIDNISTVLIDLSKKPLKEGQELLSFTVPQWIDYKDIPVLHSITLFYWDVQEELSFKNNVSLYSNTH